MKSNNENKIMKIINELINENNIHELLEGKNKRLSTDICWKNGEDKFYLYEESSSYSVDFVSKQVLKMIQNEILVLYGTVDFADRFKGKIRILPILKTFTEDEIKSRIKNYKRYMI
jgi:hypothetical protein